MEKTPSNSQIKFVPFWRNNASFGRRKGGSSNSCRSAIVKFTVYGEGGGGGGGGGSAGGG